MPQGGPESEHRSDEVNIRISRRDLLKYGKYAATAIAGVGTLAFVQRVFQAGEAQPQRLPTPTAIPPQPLSPAERALFPQPMIEEVERERERPKPTPTAERKRDIFWQTDFLIPHRTVTGKPPDAFFVSQDMVFLVGTNGYPAAYSLNDGKPLKEWKDQGYIWGADGTTAFIVKPRKLYMWDVRTGKEVTSQNIEADQTWFMDWPLWHSPKAVHIQFVNGYQTTRRGYVTVIRTPEASGAAFTHDGTILYQGERALLVGQNVSGDGSFDFSRADTLHGMSVPLSIGRSNQFFAFHDAPRSSRDMLFVIENSTILQQQMLSFIDLGTGEKLWSKKLPSDDFYGIVKTTSSREGVVYLRPRQPYKQTGRFFVIDSMGKEVKSTTLPNSVFLDHIVDENRGGFGIFSFPTLGKTVFEKPSVGREWEDKDLVINRVLGISPEGILVALYQQRGQPSLLYRIDLVQEKRLGRPIRIEGYIEDILLYEDRIILGLEARATVRVIDLQTGETVRQVSLPNRIGRLFPAKIGNEKVVFAQVGFAPEFPGILGRSRKEEKGTLVAIRL